MTEEKFIKSLTITMIFVVITLILTVVLGIFVFSKSGKSTSIFESHEQKVAYENKVKEINSLEITEEDVQKIDESNEFSNDSESSENKSENN